VADTVRLETAVPPVFGKEDIRWGKQRADDLLNEVIGLFI